HRRAGRAAHHETARGADDGDEGGGGARASAACRHRARHQRDGGGAHDRRADQGWRAMSVLVDRESRVVIQGITGREGGFHTEQMRAFGTNVVAGVSPGKGGGAQNGVPVFDTVSAAVRATGANVAGVLVPPAFAADPIMESAAAHVALTVCITEGIPVHDMVRTTELV